MKKIGLAYLSVIFTVNPFPSFSQEPFQWNRLLSEVSPFEEVAISRGLCAWGLPDEFEKNNEQWAACGRIAIKTCNVEYGECHISQTYYYNSPDEPPRYIERQHDQWFEHLRRVDEYQPLEQLRECFINQETKIMHCFMFEPL